jgi:hypothetical protein
MVKYKMYEIQTELIDFLGNNLYNKMHNACLKQRDIRRLKAAEMEFMKRTTGYSLLHNRKIQLFI